MTRWLAMLNASLGARIFAGFGIVLVILAAQALTTNLRLDEAVANFKHFGHLNAEIASILDIERNALDLQRSVLAYSYTGYEGMLPRIRRLQEDLRAQTANVLSATPDAARRDRLQRMIGHFQMYARDFETAVEDRRLHDELLEEQEHKLGGFLSRELAELVDLALTRHDTRTAAEAGIALENLLLARQNALRFFSSPDASLIRAANERLDQFSAILKRLQPRVQDSEIRQRLAGVAARVSDYDRTFVGAVQATRGYLHMVNVVLAGEAAEIARLSAELKQLTLEQQAQAMRRMEQHIAFSQTASRTVSLFAIMVGLLSAWGITRAISRPITAVTRALTALARGQKDIQIPGRGRNDEIGAMAIAADIFKGKADELENASRYKSEFLANMSHELRTPLNSMLMLSKLLARNEEGNLTSEQVASARIVYDSGHDLLRLINDVLDLSKVEAGRMEVVPELRTIDDFAAALDRQFRHVAVAKSLAFTVEAAVRRAVCSDWGKIEQIVRNLLSNAFKFTAQGEVRVRIDRAPRGLAYLDAELAGSEVLAIAVTDTGIGIPEDKQEQIFEAFRQVDGTTSRKYGGTGLGLSISRNFAQLIGGELHVTSQLGQGSTFTLYLPLDRYAEPLATTATEPSQAHSHPDPEVLFRRYAVDVLLVDDDPRNLFAIGKILQSRVRTLYTAQDGQDALDRLRQQPGIHLVLMDIMMPTLDGYETSRAIRAQPKFQDLPVIALTARALAGDREKCLEAGASDYLAKPVDPEQLLQVMAFWLERRGDLPPRDAPPSAVPPTRPPEAAPVAPPRLAKNGRAITALIVDSDMRTTFSLARALQNRAARVLMAADGRKAQELATQRIVIDIVLIAQDLPDLDSATVIRSLRDAARERELGIIVLAVNAPESPPVGADACVAKPVDLEGVLTLTQALLDASGRIAHA